MSGKRVTQLSLTALAGAFIVLALAVTYLPAPEPAPEEPTVSATTYTVENCVADECLAVPNFRYPARALPAQLEEALTRSLQDTYQSIAYQTLMLTELGEGSPFLNIIRTDQHYLAAQKALFDKYNLTIPQNAWFDRIQAPAEGLDRQLACARGYELKQETVRLYRDDLLPLVTERPDLQKVFFAIKNAAETLQAPALERCYEEALATTTQEIAE
ncbi:hypothetical protein GVX82_00975 [Patescibacteria group bacterium]|jgi:hypothetical protein|nr:hypothetical protein [Patescibacteria group bacterium]